MCGFVSVDDQDFNLQLQELIGVLFCLLQGHRSGQVLDLPLLLVIVKSKTY